MYKLTIRYNGGFSVVLWIERKEEAFHRAEFEQAKGARVSIKYVRVQEVQ